MKSVRWFLVFGKTPDIHTSGRGAIRTRNAIRSMEAEEEAQNISIQGEKMKRELEISGFTKKMKMNSKHQS